MMRRLAPVLLVVLMAIAAGCGGGNEGVTTQPPPTTTAPETGEAALRQAVRTALDGNLRLSVFVLWNNRIPGWAERSTRGPALASLRAAAENRRKRGVRVRLVVNRREVRSIRLDPSYVRATTIVLDRQQVQPSRRNGRPVGRKVTLNERARYELRRVGQSERFVVWRVVLL